MKTTALPRPAQKQKKNTVPIFKVLFAKRSLFIFASLFLASLGFLSARCTVLTYCSPFALALCCAAPGELMPAAVIGAAAGHLTAGYETVPVRYLAALIFAVIIKRIFSPKIASHPLFCGTVALFCSASTGIVTALMLDEVEATLIPYVAESFIAAASTVFWAASVNQIRKMKGLQRLSENEKTCLLISVFLIILSLSYIKIYDFSLAKILAFFVILISSYYGKTGAGSLAGIGAGTALGLGSEDVLSFASLSLAGLFSGLGASHSKLLSIVALEAGTALPILFGLNESLSFVPFAEAGIAGLIFLLIPKSFLNRYLFLSPESHSLSDSSVKSYTVSRLRFASDALSDVSSSVYEIGNKIKEMSPNKKAAIYINTMNKCCEKCGLKYYCWEREKEYTVSIFKRIEKMLENDVELTAENLPNNFGAVCIRNKALIKAFTLEHTAYKANKLAGEKAEQMRGVMSVQFDALSQLLFDMSEELEMKQFPENEMTDALIELLDYLEADYLSADVSTDSDFRVCVNIRVPYRQDVFEKEEFIKDLENICKKSFAPVKITDYEDSFKLGFYEQSALECETGFYQLSAENNRYCGDAFEFINDFSGNNGVVLADGMGKGLSANINASLCSRIVSKLLSSGFSPASAIKIANAALIVKDNDESFSSLDMVLIDSFGSKADFYKAGATCSFIKRKNKISRIELSSMPIGILDNADFSHTSLSVSEGDTILILSDGATQGDNDWINEVLLDPSHTTPGELAKAVCQTASKKQYGIHEDDISAVAIFVKNKTADKRTA